MGKRSEVENNLEHLLYVGDVSGARQILKEDISLLHSTNYYFKSLLHSVIFNGHAKMAEMVEMLLDLGANINVASERGETPLCYAAEYNRLDIVRMLIARGADLNAGKPLIKAVNKERRDVLNALIEANARAGADYVFYHAVMNGDEALVDLLLKHKHDVDSCDEEGRSLLFWAANNSCNQAHYRIAKKLLDQGADVNLTAHDYTTPLHWAVSFQCKYETQPVLEIATLYLVAGANVNAVGPDGMTPFLEAAASGNLAMIQLLMSSATPRAQLHCLDHYGRDALFYAAQNANEGVCKFFIDKGFQVNRPDSDGNTPLHRACYMGIYPNIKQLLAAGANITLRNEKGKTAIDELNTADSYEKKTARFQNCLAELQNAQEKMAVKPKVKKSAWCYHFAPKIKDDKKKSVASTYALKP